VIMTNIAMENPPNKWKFLAGKIIFLMGHGFHMLNNQRVYQLWKSLHCNFSAKLAIKYVAIWDHPMADVFWGTKQVVDFRER
jgi:hypothetical protein